MKITRSATWILFFSLALGRVAPASAKPPDIHDQLAAIPGMTVVDDIPLDRQGRIRVLDLT